VGELFHSKYHSRLEEEEVKQTVNYSMKETNAVLLNEAAGFVSKSQYRMPPNFQLLCGFPKPAIHSKNLCFIIMISAFQCELRAIPELALFQ
jgi:hypothetical protein